MLPTGKDVAAIAPQLIIMGVAILVLLLDAIWPRISKRVLSSLSVAGLVAAGIVAWRLWPKGEAKPLLQESVMADGYTAFFSLVLIVGAILSILISSEYLDREKIHHGEYYALLLFTIMGGMVMACSVNLIVIFVGLEILSISLYIMAGYRPDRLDSDESALKYFLLGAFASAFFLYGIALVYGATGHVSLPRIGSYLTDAAATGSEPSKNILLLAGVGMLLVGFCFKVAVVPFHIWTPDVYEGAPTSVTAFMSVGAKAAGFAAFLRVITSGIQDQGLQFQISAVLASIAALTMLVGNVVAVLQPNIKRMLAYSSIAHAGYILTGLVAAVRPGGGFAMSHEAQGKALSAVLFYTLVYTVSNLGAFGVVLALRKKDREVTEIADFVGLAQRYPGLSALMALFLLSLAGLPPTAGFFGKLFLIQALVAMNSPLVWLLVLFALTSTVSFYYYLGVVRAMYMERADAAEPQPVLTADWNMRIALGLSAIATLVLGLWAGGALDATSRVATSFFTSGPFSAMR